MKVAKLKIGQFIKCENTPDGKLKKAKRESPNKGQIRWLSTTPLMP